MATTLTGQFTLNMLRRTIVALLLYGLLATSSASVLRPNVYHGASTTVEFGQRGNFTEYATRRTEGIEARGDRAVVRMARMIGGGTAENEVVGIEEVTSRRKKRKGYGQMLLYSLGAAKMTILYVLMNGVAAVAGKALIVAKIALAIATAIALKKASEHDEKVSYHVVKHPYHSYEHTHSSSIDYEHGLEEDTNYRKRRRIYQRVEK